MCFPARICNRVVFPAPFPPTRSILLPGGSLRSTLFNMGTPACGACNVEEELGNDTKPHACTSRPVLAVVSTAKASLLFIISYQHAAGGYSLFMVGAVIARANHSGEHEQMVASDMPQFMSKSITPRITYINNVNLQQSALCKLGFEVQGKTRRGMASAPQQESIF